MTRTLARLVLATAAAAPLLGGAAPASACYGSQNTATVCTADRTVYEDCVYTGGSTCKQVRVTGPTCIYGTIGRNLQYYTAAC